MTMQQADHHMRSISLCWLANKESTEKEPRYAEEMLNMGTETQRSLSLLMTLSFFA